MISHLQICEVGFRLCTHGKTGSQSRRMTRCICTCTWTVYCVPCTVPCIQRSGNFRGLPLLLLHSSFLLHTTGRYAEMERERQGERGSAREQPRTDTKRKLKSSETDVASTGTTTPHAHILSTLESSQSVSHLHLLVSDRRDVSA